MDVIVGIADMKITNDPDTVLVTYSLGSCIAVVIYDPIVRVGGMLHYMLPDSSLNPDMAKKSPFMFADTGVPFLFKTSYELGAKKNRIIVKVAGGAEIMDPKGLFNIGKRNYIALRKLFWKNNVLVDKEDVGGNVNRTVRLSIATGEVRIKISSREERIL